MQAKLFDRHNTFLEESEVAEASPMLRLWEFDAQRAISGEPAAGPKTFRLEDTDESGALIYREIEAEIKGTAIGAGAESLG